ncbi:MAG: glycoside hydrolase family 65 [Halanaerobiales bacterium]
MIDRFKTVNRHNPVLSSFNKKSPLSVGNGEFVFTADITGLQTFPEHYEEEMPLCSMAQWSWHSFSTGEKYQREELKLEYYQSRSREIGYASRENGQEGLFNYLRQNPHKFHLGQIGLNIKKSDGGKIEIPDIQNIQQRLDIWQGILISKFEIDKIPVMVKTVCHPERDMLAVYIESELVNKGRIGIDIKFPYASVAKSAADWENSDKHKTVMREKGKGTMEFIRIMDETNYFLSFISPDISDNSVDKVAKHCYQINPLVGQGNFSFVCEFTERPLHIESPPGEEIVNFTEVKEDSRKHWHKYWNNGGIVDFSDSSDPRAEELERRVILSQYLTAIQCSGSYPPAETGLTCNSWYGKFHLEMHFWHAAHFTVWNRVDYLEKSLWWYHSILDKARELANSQGYSGARWPKMVGPEGYDSPSSIGPFLIWQQPHPIVYAELIYRNSKNRSKENILEYYRDIVFNTADFMISYTEYDDSNDRYVLGPPLIPAQENHLPEESLNPVFELEYWYFALNIAQQWRERLGLKRSKEWQEVSDKLSEPPVIDNLYPAHENCLDTFSRKNHDHPSMLGACGLLPGYKVNHDIMSNTLQKCLEEWQFDRVWGWDFPLMAMTAARLGKSDLAVDLLMMDYPKNTYLPNGHNRQGDKSDLPLYLPGNGALLLAVGMMTAGWEGSYEKHAPGFPDDKQWIVRYEGIDRYI